MTSPPASATTTRDGAFLALALADALSLGLPGPDYITVSPHFAGSTVTSAVSFQFNDQRGRDPLPALQAWADRFGVTVNVSTGSLSPSSTWHKFEFRHAGVLFDAYAEIKAAPCGAVALHSKVTCARPAGHDGIHESGHRPAVVWDGEPDPAAVLAQSIAAGTPVIVDEDEEDAELCDSWMPLPHGGRIKCALNDGHYGAHSALNGERRWLGYGDDARREDGSLIIRASAS